VTRRLDSPVFLCWVAFCSAVAVALATGAVIHDSAATRAAAGVGGVVAGLIVAFVSFVLLDAVKPASRAAPVAPLRVMPEAPEHEPAREPEPRRLEPLPGLAPPAPALPPPAAWAQRAPAVDDLRDRLEARLAAGRELRDEEADPRVADWVAGTQRMLEAGAPGAARYFGSLELASWPAHLARLETILREFL
jgi:hypothetical protein